MSTSGIPSSGYAAIRDPGQTTRKYLDTQISGTLSVNRLNEAQISGGNIEPTLVVTISSSTDEFKNRKMDCSLVRSNDEIVPKGIKAGIPKVYDNEFEVELKLNVPANDQEKYRLKIELSGADPIYTNEFKVI